MNESRRYTYIPFLMLISQLLLSGFVISWLNAQFKDEKNLLKKELTGLYVKSREEVLDTLLIRQVIMPSLADDTVAGQTDPMMNVSGNIPKDSITMSIFFSGDTDTSSPVKGELTLNSGGTPIEIPGVDGPERVFSHELNNLLLRSTKLFMFESSDTISDGTTLKVVLRDMIDTTMFIQAFERNLKNDWHSFSVQWIPRKNDSAIKLNRGCMQISESRIDNLPTAAIENYQWFLLMAIWPQTAFGVVLLLLTAAAFYFSHLTLKRQVALNLIRNDFVSNLTHELKTPVSTIIVALESLRKFDMKSDPDRAADYLEMSSHEIQRLDGLISKVLSHVLLEDRAEFVKQEMINFSTFIQNTMQQFRPMIEKNSAVLKLDLSPDIHIYADKLLCQGIIYNLTDNSLKYAGEKPEISVHLIKTDKAVELQFTDNGPGIPQEYAGKIFEKFFRVPGFDRHNVKGHGLGLSYVDLVMKAHGGTASVEHIKPHGCTFKLVFPFTTL